VRIAFVVLKFPSLSETFIINQITGLLDLGHDVEIFAQSDPGEPKIHPDVERYQLLERTCYYDIPDGNLKRVFKGLPLLLGNLRRSPAATLHSVNFLRYGSKASSLVLLYALSAFDNDRDFDIIQCHFGPEGTVGAFLKRAGVKGAHVTSFHGYDVNSYPYLKGPDVYKELFAVGDLFTANSRYTRDRLAELGCDADRILIVPMGLKIERFPFKERKPIPGEPVRILTLGRLVPKKGHEYAIRSVARLVNEKGYGNIEYVIAGDGPLLGTLIDLAGELGIEDRVKFPGNVDSDEVLGLLDSAHIFLLPSVTAADMDREGQALVLQEAQAVGLPVVATRHNGIPEGVLDGVSALLVPERDVGSLVRELSILLEHPEEWPRMGLKGREFVAKRYDIRTLSRRLESIYTALLADDPDALRDLLEY